MEVPVWDREKGELRILGRRETAMDAQALCDHLDSLVGVRLGEVIMNNLESRLGKQDGISLRSEKPELTIDELIKLVEGWDRMVGVGASRLTMPQNPADPILLEVSNPSVKGSEGAARAFLFSWWTGVLTSFLGKTLDYRNVVYDRETNMMKCEIVPRETQ